MSSRLAMSTRSSPRNCGSVLQFTFHVLPALRNLVSSTSVMRVLDSPLPAISTSPLLGAMHWWYTCVLASTCALRLTLAFSVEKDSGSGSME